MSNLQHALEIAVSAHSTQRQKDDSPYALHPIRLALNLTDTNARILALLHDVVEDTDVTMEDIAREGFAPEIVEALKLLTHAPEEPYESYIEKIATNPLARSVKLADLTDNMDVRRIPGPLSDKDLARLQKYHRAWTRLSRPAEAPTSPPPARPSISASLQPKPPASNPMNNAPKKTGSDDKDLARYRALKRKPWMRSLWVAACPLLLALAMLAQGNAPVALIFLVPVFVIVRNKLAFPDLKRRFENAAPAFSGAPSNYGRARS